MSGKPRTIEEVKKHREVPAELRERVKRFTRIKRGILRALEEGPMTIPEIAAKVELPLPEVTWHTMTLRKFGSIETDRVDDMDAYYYYRKKG